MVVAEADVHTHSDPESTWHQRFHSSPMKIEVNDLTIRYGDTTVLSGVNLDIRKNEIFGIIGPANSGKTSLLKALNRMDMFTPGMKVEGDIRIDGYDIRTVKNVYGLRRSIGVVFPLLVGLPLTVFENVALAPKIGRASCRERV